MAQPSIKWYTAHRGIKMAIFYIGLLADGNHRPRHWLIYFWVYHDVIQFITLIVYTRDNHGQYSSSSSFDIYLAYLAKRS